MTNTTSPDVVSDVAAAVTAGIEIAGPQPLGDLATGGPRLFTQLVPEGADVRVFDIDELSAEYDAAHAHHPRRKTGTVHVQDAASFVAYLEKHRLPCTEVYADLARESLVGVINAHEESTPDEAAENNAGRGDHRVSLELLPTEEWKVWTANDKKPLDQQRFAEHLEDNAADVVDPDSATMLEIASSLVATTGVDFKGAIRLDSGQVKVRYEETTSARAGHAGDLDIPQVFTIAIAPFVGSEPVEIPVRFRYRISNGNLSLSYAMLRPKQIARESFIQHIDAVRASIDSPVFQGRPE